MQITELLLAELDHEAVGIRKTLERVPEGKNDWKPHEKSMPLGNLATIVATVAAWLDMVVNVDELDINPPWGFNISLATVEDTSRLARSIRNQPEERTRGSAKDERPSPLQHEVAVVISR